MEHLHRKDREREDRLSANTIRRHTPEDRRDTSADHICRTWRKDGEKKEEKEISRGPEKKKEEQVA